MPSSKDSLGDRMKQNYEQVYTLSLPRRLPVIVRLDGKAFHTFTRGMDRPFDEQFVETMMAVTQTLCAEVPSTVFAYSQSDEISLLLHNYKKLGSQPWFGNEIQKIASITAATASAFFSLCYGRMGLFDSRVFVLPESEVVNYFLWRQQDATRNSIQMVAQSLYSHKELHQKSTKELQEMIFQKGLNWNDYATYKKRGFATHREVVESDEGTRDFWRLDLDIPRFHEDRHYIEKWLQVEEE